MRVGNFTALIPEGREHGTGHVALEHGQTYTIKMQNLWRDRDCDAEVTVDGKALGAFRVHRGSSMVLERSPEDNGRFTFFKADSAEGQEAGAQEVSVSDRGLISIRFRPGIKVERVHQVKPAPWYPVPYYPSPFEPWAPEKRTWTWSCGGETSVSLSSSTDQEIKTCGILRGMSNMEAGITGLTGHSDQQFTDVAALLYDPLEEVTVHLRLVSASVATVRKLQPARSSPVPAAV